MEWDKTALAEAGFNLELNDDGSVANEEEFQRWLQQ